MPRPERRKMLMPTALDRLMGAAAAGQGDLRIDIRRLRQSVAQNLEWLLNTRSSFHDEDLAGTPSVAASHVAFGLPDLSRYSPTNEADASTIAELLRTAIRRFEPRLVPSSVHVSFMPAEENKLGPLQYRIDAILFVEPIDEPVAFDTRVQISGRVDIREVSG